MSALTRVERALHNAVRELGCCVCVLSGLGETPCDVHHLLSGGRRMGESFVLGLCPPHHRGGRNDREVVSRHPWRREFEARYGTELYLLRETRRLVLARNLYNVPEGAEKLTFCTSCRSDQPSATFVKLNRYRESCLECAVGRDEYLKGRAARPSKARHSEGVML